MLYGTRRSRLVFASSTMIQQPVNSCSRTTGRLTLSACRVLPQQPTLLGFEQSSGEDLPRATPPRPGQHSTTPDWRVTER